MKIATKERTSVAKAVAYLVEKLHKKVPGITTQTIDPYEDEDFALEVITPKSCSLESVEYECNKTCIEIEDRFDVFILTKVVSG